MKGLLQFISRVWFMVSGALIVGASDWRWYLGSLGCYLLGAGFDLASREQPD